MDIFTDYQNIFTDRKPKKKSLASTHEKMSFPYPTQLYKAKTKQIK